MKQVNQPYVMFCDAHARVSTAQGVLNYMNAIVLK